MIYVSEDQLQQVQYLIEQSIQGNHLLFEAEDIKDALDTISDFPKIELDDEYAYQVEHHIERLILSASLDQKKAYLESLDKKTFRLMIKTYLNIVENDLFERSKVRH